eukprot:6483130-Amphidinium_carterae.2
MSGVLIGSGVHKGLGPARHGFLLRVLSQVSQPELSLQLFFQDKAQSLRCMLPWGFINYFFEFVAWVGELVQLG